MCRKSQVLVWIVLLCLLVSCNRIGGSTSTTDIEAPQPEPGKSTVVGRVVSETSGEPLAETIVRLSEVYREEEGEGGAYVLDIAFSPGDITDENGVFIIEDVEAMEYVIVVGDVYSVHEIIHDPSGLPKVWNAGPDEVLQVGDLVVNFEP